MALLGAWQCSHILTELANLAEHELQGEAPLQVFIGVIIIVNQGNGRSLSG
jgi:hypothetical protein